MQTLIIHQETCRNIPDFNAYHISESGRVYRTKQTSNKSISTSNYTYVSENKIHFKPNNASAHGRVSLIDDHGKLHNLNVAFLVAHAFSLVQKSSQFKKRDIHYIDGDRHNLHFTNLKVVDKTYPNSKLTFSDIKTIKKHLRRGDSLRHISRLFDISEMQINRIKTGENWGNGKRKIKAPVAPFQVDDPSMRKYIATFESKQLNVIVKKPFNIKRNPKNPSENIIQGIVKGYKLTKTHSNITRAKKNVARLNDYFFAQ